MDIREFESTEFADEFPATVEAYLRLAPLAELVGRSDAIGATRLFACPPFEPFEVLTLTFYEGEVHASHVVSDAEAWERVACGEDAAEYTKFETRQRRFEFSELPTVMQGWPQMAEASERVESSIADNPDGLAYFHLAYGDGVNSLRLWFSPAKGANSLLSQLLEGYKQINAALPDAGAGGAFTQPGGMT